MRCFVSICLLFSFALPAFAQKKGETIVVIAASSAEVREGDDLKGIAMRGAQLRVDDVKGEWIWVRFHNYKGEYVKGWINRKEIMPLKPISKVIDFYTTAIKQNPTSRDYNSRGMLQYSVRKYDAAIDDYNKSIRLAPKEASYWYNRALTYADKREYAKAVKDYDEAIRLNPKHMYFWVSRGIARRNMGEYDKAIKDYDEAIRLDPKYTINWNARADIWFIKKEYGKAIKDYEEAVRLNPKFWNPRCNLGLLRATCLDAKYRNGKQALKDTKRACELTKWKNGYALTAYAAAWAELGNFDEATKQLQKAINFNPQEDKTTRLYLLKRYKAKQPNRTE